MLVIDCCLRGEDSATRRYYQAYLEAAAPERVEMVELARLGLRPLDWETLALRDRLSAEGRFDHVLFHLARQFRDAEEILIAAPFWDLSFPAILKIYLERISVTNITFGYDEQGNNVGLCKAGKLLLITTRGGNFSLPETAWMEMGARQLEALCAMYGIPSFQCLAAEGLDDIRNDKEAILAEAMGRADAMAEVF